MRNAYMNRNCGMSLIEVLVGMVIGLIGIVVIMQVYLVNENFKRTTTSAGSAQINSSIALYTLERDIMSAGYGIGYASALACGNLRYYFNGTYSSPPGPVLGALPSLRVAPVVIGDGGAGPDSISVMYAGSNSRVVPATVAVTMANAGASIRVDSVAGFSSAPGDLVMIASAGNCTLTQLTDVNTATLDLVHASGASLWNPAAGGSLTAHGKGAQVLNLGKPTFNTYSISADKLQLVRLFTWTASNVVPSLNNSAAAISLVDDIVDLKAQYGKDLNGDGIVDTYEVTMPTSDVEWKQVLAVRVAVVARSQNYEKPVSGTTCTATTTQPAWSGSFVVTTSPTNPVARPFNISLPSCHTYRVLETVIPLRNMIWSRS